MLINYRTNISPISNKYINLHTLQLILLTTELILKLIFPIIPPSVLILSIFSVINLIDLIFFYHYLT